jgi:hypothetical protein
VEKLNLKKEKFIYKKRGKIFGKYRKSGKNYTWLLSGFPIKIIQVI